ncbi:hypothetical protein K439DRAFT_1612436 [Ramaria rubella]|nr:hypothetical protein K439DRAFT_1612436 [Ramaria rubella]
MANLKGLAVDTYLGHECSIHIDKYAHEGHEQLAEKGLYACIYQHSTYLLKTFKSEWIVQHGAYFGHFEIHHMLKYLVTTTQELDMLLQHHVMINLEFTLGVRPSAMGWSYLEWKKEGKYLKLKTDVIWEHLKGFNLIEVKQLPTHSQAVSKAQNVQFDLGPVLLSLLLKQGALFHSSLEQLLANNSAEILICPDHKNSPIFLMIHLNGCSLVISEPMSATGLGSVFCHIGLTLRVW